MCHGRSKAQISPDYANSDNGICKSGGFIRRIAGFSLIRTFSKRAAQTPSKSVFKYCKKFRRFCDCIRDSIGPCEDPRYLISRCSDEFSAAKLARYDTSIYPPIKVLPVSVPHPDDRSRASVYPVSVVPAKSTNSRANRFIIYITHNFEIITLYIP